MSTSSAPAPAAWETDNLPTTYADTSRFLAKARMFRWSLLIELNDGEFECDAFEATDEFDALAPGEAFTVRGYRHDFSR